MLLQACRGNISSFVADLEELVRDERFSIPLCLTFPFDALDENKRLLVALSSVVSNLMNDALTIMNQPTQDSDTEKSLVRFISITLRANWTRYYCSIVCEML